MPRPRFCRRFGPAVAAAVFRRPQRASPAGFGFDKDEIAKTAAAAAVGAFEGVGRRIAGLAAADAV
eukprot:354129-Lingulodinium_polyedra.AAC.1